LGRIGRRSKRKRKKRKEKRIERLLGGIGGGPDDWRPSNMGPAGTTRILVQKEKKAGGDPHQKGARGPGGKKWGQDSPEQLRGGESRREGGIKEEKRMKFVLQK